MGKDTQIPFDEIMDRHLEEYSIDNDGLEQIIKADLEAKKMHCLSMLDYADLLAVRSTIDEWEVRSIVDREDALSSFKDDYLTRRKIVRSQIIIHFCSWLRGQLFRQNKIMESQSKGLQWLKSKMSLRLLSSDLEQNDFIDDQDRFSRIFDCGNRKAVLDLNLPNWLKGLNHLAFLFFRLEGEKFVSQAPERLTELISIEGKQIKYRSLVTTRNRVRKRYNTSKELMLEESEFEQIDDRVKYLVQFEEKIKNIPEK